MIITSFFQNNSMLLLLWLFVFAISLAIEWIIKKQIAIHFTFGSVISMILTCLGEKFLVQIIVFFLFSLITLFFQLFLKRKNRL